MKPLSTDSLMAGLLGKLAWAVFHRRGWFLYPHLVLFPLCLFYTVKFLQFDTSRSSLVGANKRYHQNYLKFKKDFPTQDDLVVVVESEDPEKNRQFVERLGRKLEVETNLFKDVFYKGDLKMLGSKALLFISDETPPTISASDIRELASLTAKLTQPSNAVSRFVHGQLSDATRQALTGSMAGTAPLLETLASDLNRLLHGPLIFETERFAGVALRAKTQQLLGEKPDGEELVQLNRLLLEDAFPKELSRSRLEELSRKLLDYRPVIEKFAQTTNLVSLFEMINHQFQTASREQNNQTTALVRTLPALESIVTQATASLRRSGMPPSPGVMALFSAGKEVEKQIYITFAEGRIYLVTAQAPTEKLNAKAVKRLRELVQATLAEVPGLNVGLTGKPVLEIDEMRQSERDTALATVVSFVLVFVIIIFGYGKISRRIKADVCLIVGMVYTMAFTTWAIGHLNILTITFAPILVGIAIDFGVHLIARYEEELQRGQLVEDAMRKAMVWTGLGIVTGCLTTGGAFLAMAVTNFRGIQEMGVICGGGMVICLVPMLTLLPALLLRGQQSVILPVLGPRTDYRARIESLWLRRPVTVTLLTVALCALAVTQFRKITFDYNLLNMQSAGLPSVAFEEKLIQAGANAPVGDRTNAPARSVLFAVVIANSVSEAAELEDRIRKLPSVADVDSIAKLLMEDQAGKLKLIGEIKAGLGSLRFATPDLAPVNLAALSDTLWPTTGYLGYGEQESKKDAAAIRRQLLSLKRAVENLRWEMARGNAQEQLACADKLGFYQRAFFEDLRDTFATLRGQDNRERLQIEDLPPTLRSRFVGAGGKQLLQVYPKKDVWQRSNQEEFIRELRTALDPHDTNEPVITGTPVQLYEYTTLLKRSYEQAALYSLAAISLLVLIHFRSLWSLILALLPVAIGSIWLGGIMGYFGIPFNPANIMTLPLVIGIGVTNGIHILNRFAEERTPSILAKSTGKAVLVSGLTTMAGFGSLTLAQHRGIESLGYVMSIGVATCMIAGLVFLPAVLNLILRRGQLKKQPSADNAQSAPGREEPR